MAYFVLMFYGHLISFPSLTLPTNIYLSWLWVLRDLSSVLSLHFGPQFSGWIWIWTPVSPARWFLHGVQNFKFLH